MHARLLQSIVVIYKSINKQFPKMLAKIHQTSHSRLSDS